MAGTFVVRFPDGSKEFILPSRDLEIGNHLWHDGVRYHVISVFEDDHGNVTVTVEPGADTLGDKLSSEEGAVVLGLAE